MGRYLQMYLNDGAGILEKSSVEEMIFNSVPFQEVYHYGMGLGTIHNDAGELLVLHGGNVENYTTSMILMPERGIAVIAMFNACDYLVANHMADAFTMNVMNKFIDAQTDDLSSSAYLFGHALINVILFAALLLSALPLLLMKRWRVKNKGKVKRSSAIFASLLHIALPTFVWMMFPMYGLPISVIRGFVGFSPDVFIVLAASSAILYVGGIIKLVYIVSSRKAKQNMPHNCTQ